MIRKVELEDIRVIQNVNKVALKDAFPVENALEMLEKIVADQQRILFVAVVDGAVVGYVHAAVVTQTICFETILILGLAVTPSYHRQDIGRHLMAEVEKWGQTKETRVIKLASGAGRNVAH